jgi:hypothetical protein
MSLSLAGVAVAHFLLSLPCSAGAGDKNEAGAMTFDEIVWVQRKEPHVSLLYLVVPEYTTEVAKYNELVVRHAKDALRAAEKITTKDATGVSWFAGKFNVVFVIRHDKAGRSGAATGFSGEQLREIAAARPDVALRLVDQHAWGLAKLPLVRH